MTMSMHPRPEVPQKPLKWYKALNSAKHRFEAAAFLVEGEKAVRQIVEGHAGEIREILALPRLASHFPNLPLRILNQKQFAAISNAKAPQGVMAVVRLPLNTYTEEIPSVPGGRILLLEDIQDPGNVGTLIRTASAFDFSGVILSEECADPFSPKVAQSSAGALLSLWIRRTDKYLEMVKTLLHRGCTLIAADLRGSEAPSTMSKYNNIILALGNEATGAGEPLLQLAQHRVKIPVNSEKAESLNVAICGAILMYLNTLKA